MRFLATVAMVPMTSRELLRLLVVGLVLAAYTGACKKVTPEDPPGISTSTMR